MIKTPPKPLETKEPRPYMIKISGPFDVVFTSIDTIIIIGDVIIIAINEPTISIILLTDLLSILSKGIYLIFIKGIPPISST